MADLHPDVVQALDRGQRRVARKIVRIGERRGESKRKINANLAIGLVESRLRNLPGGDADSEGYRQERPSVGYKNPRNTRAAINRAYNEMDQLDRGQSAGELAADIQRPRADLRGRYSEELPDAKAIRRSLQRGEGSPLSGGQSRTQVSLNQRTIPGQSFASERQAARRQLLLGGDIDMAKLLEYKSSINSLKDVPDRQVRGDLTVTRTAGKPVQTRGKKTGAPRGGKGGIYEVFYDPAGEYWDSGGVRKGSIGGHSNHVHLSADSKYVVRAGKLAQSMGLTVGEQSRFGGKPTGGHTEGSFHYKDMAIDVSGDPAKMRKFARIMMEEARRGRGR
jgi:hypothetical protein